MKRSDSSQHSRTGTDEFNVGHDTVSLFSAAFSVLLAAPVPDSESDLSLVVGSYDPDVVLKHGIRIRGAIYASDELHALAARSGVPIQTRIVGKAPAICTVRTEHEPEWLVVPRTG